MHAIPIMIVVIEIFSYQPNFKRAAPRQAQRRSNMTKPTLDHRSSINAQYSEAE
jgi:hypothetical protein